MDVVAEQMAREERPAAVRLHEQLDGRFLLRLAAEDLGDDALHLAAIALVDQPGAPGDQGIGAGDQAGQAGDAALDQLARGDRLAVGAAELGPGQHVGQHHAHGAGRVGAQRQPAQVQAVIGDRQAVADAAARAGSPSARGNR